jgi:hypothetical protein
MFEETNLPANTPAPDPQSAVPSSAGPTSDAPIDNTLQPPAATAPAQPQLQLQPSEAPKPAGSFFKNISHSFFAAVTGALAGGDPVAYSTDESGKQIATKIPQTSGDRMRRIAEAALTGLAAGAQVHRPGANALAGMGAGFAAEQQQAQAQDLLKRQQSKEQFEQEQSALANKYIRAQHNITTLSLFQKGIDDANEHDPERLKTDAIRASAEDYISRNPSTSMTAQVLSADEARAMQAADKNNPASVTHAFFPYGMREAKQNGQTVYEKDGVTPKMEGQVFVIGGGAKDGKMPLPQTFVADLKKYGAMAGIGRVDDVKAGDEWNLDRFLNAGARMNPVKEKEIEGWREPKLGENAVKVDGQYMQENTFTHERRAYGATPQETEKINAQIDKDHAEAEKFRGEAAKARSDAANKGEKPIYAFNTKTNQTELTNRAAMTANPGVYTNPRDVKQSDIEKDQQFNRQMADVQLNFSRYQTAKNALSTGTISPEHKDAATRILADEKMGGYVTNELTFQNYMNQINQGEKAASWNKLTPAEQEVLSGYLRAKASVVAYQKALSGVGKPNKEVMEIEMNNLPAPIVGKSASDTQFNAFQENLDTATQGYVKMPGSESPKEVRQRVEAEAAKKAGATHVYDPGSGQTIPVGKTPVTNYKGQVLGYFLSGDSGEWVRFPKQ